MSKKNILVAEDDENIRNGIIDILENENFNPVAAKNGKETMEIFEKNTIDLVILDVMMPEKSGYEVIMEIRRKNLQVPVIMLTAKGEESDKVLGLNLGADDYITKPFGINEFTARIKAALRRVSNSDEALLENDAFNFGNSVVYPKKYLLKNKSEESILTKRELEIIRYFFLKKGEVVTREDLLNKVWGIEYYGTTRTLDQHVSMIRKKVEKDTSCPEFIKTVHGLGYIYEP